MIGVVITAHNQQEDLSACINSIANQDTPLKIVVVDDASDGGGVMVSHSNIIHSVICMRNNVGVQRARNIGWWELKDSCEYMLFCDADIRWKPDAFVLMKNVLQRNREDNPKISYAYGGYNRHGSITGVFTSQEFNADLLHQYNFISTMSLVLTSSLPYAPFIQDEERLQDWSLWLRMFNNGHIGVFVDAILFDAHYDENSISTRSLEDYRKWQKVMLGRYVNGKR